MDKIKTTFMEKLGVSPSNENLLLTVYYTFFTSGMVSNILGTVLPDIRKAYGISYVFSGTVYSSHQIGNMIAAVAVGYLPYLIGRKKTTTILYSCFILGLFLIVSGTTPAILLIAFILTGISRGTLSNISNVVVAETTKNKTAGLNLLHASFALGALLGPIALIAISLFIKIDNWKYSLYLMVLIMIPGVIFLISSNLSNKPQVKPQKAQTTLSLPFYKAGGFWINVGILFFYLCSESGNIGWLVTYFNDTGIMTPSLARIMPSLLWIMIMLGRLSIASISSKINKNTLLIILSTLNALFFILMISTRKMPIVIAGVLGTGFSMAGIYPTVFATMKSEYNSSTVAVGTIIGIGLLGAISMPIIIGAVAEKVTLTSIIKGLSQSQAETAGVSYAISLIAFSLIAMIILTIIKYLVERKKQIA